MKIHIITSCIALSLLLLTAVDCQSQSDVQFRATVRIYASEGGAGIAVGRAGADVLVLTAYHVVKGPRDIHVSFFEKKTLKFPARTVKFDEKLDIALLRVSVTGAGGLPDNLPVLSVNGEMKIGGAVVIIGHPAGSEWRPRFEHITDLPRYDDPYRFLYTNPNVARGFSGGSVFDEKGSLIGIVLGREPSDDAIALKISEVLKLLREGWGYKTSLIQSASGPAKSVVLSPKPIPLSLELTRISVLQKGGQGAVRWSYRVYLDEEELIFEGANTYKEGREGRPYTHSVGDKKEVAFTLGRSHTLQVIAVRKGGREQAEKRLHLSLKDATGTELAVPLIINLESKGSFIFYFVLKRLDSQSFPRNKVVVTGDKSFFEDIKRQVTDLQALMAESEKIEKETDLDRLRILFAGWRIRCRLVLEQVDQHRSQLTGLPSNFRAQFESITGTPSEDVSKLQRHELTVRILVGFQIMSTVIFTIK